ncbi:hypothetical protein H4R34_002826 [Dimargaris verticillata]|uniref:Uncharacterized protein n=1 Tax=Dimargaris verticillata TaxID=2761393 RepID=A0A9W8E8W2_9FUNG|nr:hypothetical protein H4R34_002826 [Dimargaris verticillata]
MHRSFSIPPRPSPAQTPVVAATQARAPTTRSRLPWPLRADSTAPASTAGLTGLFRLRCLPSVLRLTLWGLCCIVLWTLTVPALSILTQRSQHADKNIFTVLLSPPHLTTNAPTTAYARGTSLTAATSEAFPGILATVRILAVDTTQQQVHLTIALRCTPASGHIDQHHRLTQALAIDYGSGQFTLPEGSRMPINTHISVTASTGSPKQYPLDRYAFILPLEYHSLEAVNHTTSSNTRVPTAFTVDLAGSTGMAAGSVRPSADAAANPEPTILLALLRPLSTQVAVLAVAIIMYGVTVPLLVLTGRYWWLRPSMQPPISLFLASGLVAMILPLLRWQLPHQPVSPGLVDYWCFYWNWAVALVCTAVLVILYHARCDSFSQALPGLEPAPVLRSTSENMRRFGMVRFPQHVRQGFRQV